MILGIGNDIVDMLRIERTIQRFGHRFIERLFTTGERDFCQSKPTHGRRLESYACRFAAKEACAKALGSGIAQGVYWRDIEVVRQRPGPPTLRLHGGAYQRLLSITPSGYRSMTHISLSGEKNLAQAWVIIDAVMIP